MPRALNSKLNEVLTHKGFLRSRNDYVTNQDRMVIEITRSRVNMKSKLTNFKNNSRIEGYNGK